MIYMISYDLSPSTSRDAVMDDIKSFGTWCKYLTTTFLIDTNQSVDDVTSVCTRHLSNDDRMIIAPVSGKINGHLTHDQWDWINNNL